MAESRNESRNVKQKFDGTKTCAGIVDDMRASVRLSAHPLYVSRKDVPGNLVEAEREIYKAQVTGKPANVVDKIVDGKLEKFVAPSVCSSRVLSKTPIKPSATCSRPRSPSSAKEHMAAAHIIPKTTGTYFIIVSVEESPAARTHWALAYGFR